MRYRAAIALTLALAALAILPPHAGSDVWFFDDADTNGRWGYEPSQPETPAWEPMYPGALSWYATIPLHPDTTYYAYTHEINRDYRGWHFRSGLWTTKTIQSGTNSVYASFLIYDFGPPETYVFVESDSAVSEPWNTALALDFDFGVLPSGEEYKTIGKSFVVVFTFKGNPLDTYIHWDGFGSASSCLYCYPDFQPWDNVVCEYSAGIQPAHPDTFWYDVMPNGPRYDFHVRVFDDDINNYSNWVEPEGWTHKLHKMQVGTECEWWVSWFDSDMGDPIGGIHDIFWPTRFGFTNRNRAVWSRWITSADGGQDPYLAPADSSGNHSLPGTHETDGHGIRVHVPSRAPDANDPIGPVPIDRGRVDAHACVADWDLDELADLAHCGQRIDSRGVVTTVYRNEGGTLTPWQELEGVRSNSSGCMAWGDVNGDELPDLAVAGLSDSGGVAKVYVNDGTGLFEWDGQDLTGVSLASVAWGDYDEDDDLDLLVQGLGAAPLTVLYDNDGTGGLVPVDSLIGLCQGSADWRDYDCDGDLDLLTTGFDGSDPRTVLYENGPVGTLTAVGSLGLPDVWRSDAEWCDYDRDGDPDLALLGRSAAGASMARIYANDGGGVLSLVAELLQIEQGACAWGDFDLDGDYDVAFCGYAGPGYTTAVFENMDGAFVDTGWSLPGVGRGSLSWMDVDGDCDCDLILTGTDGTEYHSDLYENVRWPTGVPDGPNNPASSGQRGLRQNYPNPFNPSTKIVFGLTSEASVAIDIYDLAGRLVTNVAEGVYQPGEHEVVWDGRDAAGHQVATGVYFYSMRSGSFECRKKMVLLK